jgi:hypothetical protein
MIQVSSAIMCCLSVLDLAVDCIDGKITHRKYRHMIVLQLHPLHTLIDKVQTQLFD